MLYAHMNISQDDEHMYILVYVAACAAATLLNGWNLNAFAASAALLLVSTGSSTLQAGQSITANVSHLSGPQCAECKDHCTLG